MDRRVRKDTHHDCLFGLYELFGGSRGGEVARDLSLFVRRKGLSRSFWREWIWKPEDLHNFTI